MIQIAAIGLVRGWTDFQRGVVAEPNLQPLSYRNSGASNVDTHAMDENGYLYLGIMMGGRAVVLDRDGIPVANILAPGFEEGKLLYTPNLALSRTDRFGYLLASDSEQAVVLRFPTFAPGQELFSHR